MPVKLLGLPIWNELEELRPSILAVHEGIYGGLIGLAFALLIAMTVVACKRPTLGRATLIFYSISSVNLILLIYLVVTLEIQRSITAVYSICSIWDLTQRTAHGIQRLTCSAVFRPDHSSASGVDVEAKFDVIQVVLIWISDAAIAYRAAILARSKFSRITLGILYALCFFAGILVILSSLHIASVFENIATGTSYVFLCSSILSNLVSTGLFGYILWKHRKFLETIRMNGGCRKSLSDRVLSTVVESGVVYFVFQISYTVYTSVRSRDSLDDLCYVWQALYIGFSGTYPAIIFLVASAQALRNDETFEEYLSTVATGFVGY